MRESVRPRVRYRRLNEGSAARGEVYTASSRKPTVFQEEAREITERADRQKGLTVLVTRTDCRTLPSGWPEYSREIYPRGFVYLELQIFLRARRARGCWPCREKQRSRRASREEAGRGETDVSPRKEEKHLAAGLEMTRKGAWLSSVRALARDAARELARA